MGKNSNKRAQRKPDKSGTGRNAKNLQISVSAPQNDAPEPLEKLEPPQTPCNEDLNFEDFEYDAEIAMGAASPMVLQSPVVKMLGRSELQGAARPTLVEITKGPTEVEFPADVQRPASSSAKQAAKSKIESAIDGLDEFKGLDKSPVDPVPPHIPRAPNKLQSPLKETAVVNPVVEKSPDTSDDFADAPETPKVELQRSTSKGSQKLDELEGEYEGFMAELDRESVPELPSVPSIHSVNMASTNAKPKEIVIGGGKPSEQERGESRSAGRAENASAGRAENASAGRAENASAGRAENASAGRAENGSAGRAENASAGRAENGSAGRAENASSGRAENASAGRAENASTGRAENASAGRAENGLAPKESPPAPKDEANQAARESSSPRITSPRTTSPRITSPRIPVLENQNPQLASKDLKPKVVSTEGKPREDLKNSNPNHKEAFPAQNNAQKVSQKVTPQTVPVVPASPQNDTSKGTSRGTSKGTPNGTPKPEEKSELETARKGLRSTPTKIGPPPLKTRPSQLKEKVAPIQNKDPSQIVKEAKAKTLANGGATVSPNTSPIIAKIPKRPEASRPESTKAKPIEARVSKPELASLDKATIKAVPTVKITSAEEADKEFSDADRSEKMKAPAPAPVASGDAPAVTPVAADRKLQSDYDENNPIVGVAVVGFHHTRGPEVEYWVGPNGNQADLWPYLPFQSMPDGSHSYEENICYFTVLYDPSTGTAPNPTPERDTEGLIIEKSNFNKVETLFGISCTRQIAAEDLHNKTPDVTRSTVLKSLVVLARKPVFGPIKEKLKVVTRTYFDQKDFDDRKIIDNLYENVTHMFKHPHSHSEGDFLVGTNPRELVHSFGIQLMVIFKALLLEKKIAFYAADTENLCATQFSLISLIPDLLNNLQDCGSPLLSIYETKLEKPTFLRTSDRSSLLKFLGLPLQVFAAGGMFTPFLPLQLVEELKQPEMQYGMFGSTNKIFFSQGVEYDLFVDVDTHKVTINNPSLRKALDPSSADKAFFNPILQSVKNTWDSENAEQPTSLGYNGSDDYIRHSFEDYLISLVSSAKYHQHLTKGSSSSLLSRDYPTNPLKAFNTTWAEMWQQTNNYRIFNKFTDEELFDVVEPQHIGLLNNRKRSDAISEVRGLSKKEETAASPSPAAGTLSGKFFSMFGWSSAAPAAASAAAPETTPDTAPDTASSVAAGQSTPEQALDTPESIDSGERPVTPPNLPPEDARAGSQSTPRSPNRKLFFWNK